LSDASIAALAELSLTSSSATYPGSFGMLAPVSTTTGRVSYQSRGTAVSAASQVTGTLGDITYVVTGLSDILADSAVLRINGVDNNSSSSDQGAGNYGNYPLYLFRRGGSSLPFNGRFYGMTIVNKLLSTAELEQLETYTNSKTKAFG